MVTAPTLYSVMIAAIVFCGFSMAAIGRALYPPQNASQTTIELVLPEPPRPIGLLPAESAPVLTVAPPISSIPTPGTMAETPTATVVTTTPALLAERLTASVTRPTTTAIAPLPAAPIAPETLPLYRPVLLDGTTRMLRSHSTTIPSPWEPESDRYWNQNSTLTYPNCVPMLAGSAT